MTPCPCRAYPFPHRPGSGRCEGNGETAVPVCRECGSTSIEYHHKWYGAREKGSGVQLEPDEPEWLGCAICESDDIAISIADWTVDYTVREYLEDAADARADYDFERYNER